MHLHVPIYVSVFQFVIIREQEPYASLLRTFTMAHSFNELAAYDDATPPILVCSVFER